MPNSFPNQYEARPMYQPFPYYVPNFAPPMPSPYMPMYMYTPTQQPIPLTSPSMIQQYPVVLQASTPPNIPFITQHPPLLPPNIPAPLARPLIMKPAIKPESSGIQARAQKPEEKIPVEKPMEIDKDGICSAMREFSSSKYRYVFKCIIRNMSMHIRKNRNEIVAILEKLGFNMSDIEHAFFKVNAQSDTVGKKGCDRSSYIMVNQILIDKNIYTHILQETLWAIIKTWDDGKTGKVSETNIELYKKACKSLYEETTKILGKTASGIEFS